MTENISQLNKRLYDEATRILTAMPLNNRFIIGDETYFFKNIKGLVFIQGHNSTFMQYMACLDYNDRLKKNYR